MRGGRRTGDFVDDEGGEEGVGEEEKVGDEEGERVGARGDGLDEVEGLEGEGWRFGGHFGGGGAPRRVVWWWWWWWC